MSNRQLSALEWHRLRVDAHVNLSRGFLYSYTYTNTLGAGGADVLRLVTADKPVALFAMRLHTDGSRGALFEYYAGGDVTGGTPIFESPVNHDQTAPHPFDVANDGATVDVPGAKIGELLVDGSGHSAVLGQSDLPRNILAANQDYHMVVTNLDNQSAEIRIDIEAGALDARPPGL